MMALSRDYREGVIGPKGCHVSERRNKEATLCVGGGHFLT